MTKEVNDQAHHRPSMTIRLFACSVHQAVIDRNARHGAGTGRSGELYTHIIILLMSCVHVMHSCIIYIYICILIYLQIIRYMIMSYMQNVTYLYMYTNTCNRTFIVSSRPSLALPSDQAIGEILHRICCRFQWESW